MKWLTTTRSWWWLTSIAALNRRSKLPTANNKTNVTQLLPHTHHGQHAANKNGTHAASCLGLVARGHAAQQPDDHHGRHTAFQRGKQRLGRRRQQPAAAAGQAVHHPPGGPGP